MIPKIIHLCWLSGDAFPSTIEKCLKTWRHHLADYDIWLWGKTPKDTSCLKGLNIIEKHFDINSISWTRQAYEAKKYAFAADYIRLYALYNYGGIYLDADVIIYKSFNDLLNIPYFIGCDQIRAFEAAVIGTEKNNTWIKDILDAYADKSFVKRDGSYDITELPVRFHHEMVKLGYTFRLITCKEDFKRGQEKHIEVFDRHFFNSRNAVEVRRTKKSYCAHNYTGSWQKEGYGHSFKDRLPNWLLAIIYTIGQKTWARNKYAWFQIPFNNNKCNR